MNADELIKGAEDMRHKSYDEANIRGAKPSWSGYNLGYAEALANIRRLSRKKGEE